MVSSTRALVLSVLLIAGVALFGAIVMVYVTQQGRSAPTDPGSAMPDLASPGEADDVSIDLDLYRDFYIPEFELTDQDGRAIDESILEGRYSVVDFFFTTCPLACPGMNAQMQRVQEETEGSGLRLLSISVSGDYDTPEVLTAYSERLAADPERWRFLTGDQQYVADLVMTGLKFDVAPDDSFEIELPDGGMMFNIQHPTKLLLIGPDRRVVAMASYQSPEEVTALIELAREKAGGG